MVALLFDCIQTRTNSLGNMEEMVKILAGIQCDWCMYLDNLKLRRNSEMCFGTQWMNLSSSRLMVDYIQLKVVVTPPH